MPNSIIQPNRICGLMWFSTVFMVMILAVVFFAGKKKSVWKDLRIWFLKYIAKP